MNSQDSGHVRVGFYLPLSFFSPPICCKQAEQILLLSAQSWVQSQGACHLGPQCQQPNCPLVLVETILLSSPHSGTGSESGCLPSRSIVPAIHLSLRVAGDVPSYLPAFLTATDLSCITIKPPLPFMSREGQIKGLLQWVAC